MICINRSLSWQKLNRGRIMASVDGEFKLLQCSPTAFEDTLANVDGKRTISQVESALSKKYPLAGIRPFINALIGANILKLENKEEKLAKTNVLVLGDGILAPFISSLSKKYSLCTTCMTIEQYSQTNSAISNFDFAIVCPEKASYEQLLNINQLLNNSGIAFMLLYYDGINMILGPTVVPRKTACLECIITYRLSEINKKLPASQNVGLADIGLLNFSENCIGRFANEELLYFCTQAVREACRYKNDSSNLAYLEKQQHYACGNPDPVKIVSFFPTTECCYCHGISKHYYCKKEAFSISGDLPNKTALNKICYTSGGFRSCDDKTAKNFVTNALAGVGIAVKVDRVATPFDTIIPVYRASVESSPIKDTPYYFRSVVSHGKGLSESQAYLSATFEMAERLSASHCGETPILEAPYNSVKEQAINLNQLYATVTNNNTEFEKLDPKKPIDWVAAQSLVSGKEVLVPAFMAFLSGTKFKGQFLSNGSSGLSAGATLEDAILQGLFELIEHDAWVIGQANRIPLPLLDYNTSANEKLKNSINSVRSLGYNVLTRDYTNDLGFPVYRTWIVNNNDFTHYAINGVGASYTPEIALERSFTEAIQAADIMINRAKTNFGSIKSEYLASTKDSLYSLDYFVQKDINGRAKVNSITDHTVKPFETVEKMIEATIKQIRNVMPNCDVLYVNLTNHALGVPVVRVIITGEMQMMNYPLISISPRLYNFAEKMGYSSKTGKINELYFGPYPH